MSQSKVLAHLVSQEASLLICLLLCPHKACARLFFPSVIRAPINLHNLYRLLLGGPCPAGGKLSQEHEERRMKGSSYETGLGKARSGREWVQTRREGQGLQVSRGEDKSTGVSTRFQPSVEQAGG